MSDSEAEAPIPPNQGATPQHPALTTVPATVLATNVSTANADPLPKSAFPEEPSEESSEESSGGLFLAQNNLTPREQEIVLLVVRGRNNPYIREQLNISNNTLKTHLRNAYQKLSVSNRQELITRFNEFVAK